MTSYKELGLVNTKDMFAKAFSGGFAVPAYNFNNLEQLQAIIMACVETKSPVILQVSKGARDYAQHQLAPQYGQRRIGICQGTWLSNPYRPASRPRRHVRDLQGLHRQRIFLSHDRWIALFLRRKRSPHKTCRRIRP